MKKVVLIVLSLFLVKASICQTWNLMWSDEFNGTALNTANWSHDLGSGHSYGLWGWGNGELQYYQPDNTSLSGGVLTIEAREEPGGISDFYSGHNTYYYSSSKIHTRDKFEFTFGKVEARIKTIDGQGYWPAFWMLPGEGCWPETGEIDIMEQWGNDGNTNVTTGAAHLGNCGESSTYQVGTSSISSGSYADDFHVYSVIWYEDYIGWYIDDQLFHSVTPSSYPSGSNWPFNNNDWYLILNLAITSSGPNGNTSFPNEIQVDYVRVYQTNDILGCTDPSASNYNPSANLDDGNCVFPFTFNVDMNCTTISYNQVYVTGPFTNWCGDCHPLSDANNDGIWSTTLDFPSGDIEYKYAVDNWADQENLIDDMQNGASCAPITDYQNFANREVEVSSGVSFDTYGSCDLCSGPVNGCTDPSAINYNSNATLDDGSCTYSGCTDINAVNYNSSSTQDDGTCEYEIVFNVDMSCSEENFSTVYLTGPFSNWCGNCNPLTDSNNDGIWTAAYVFPSGNVEYKYELDNWSTQENLVDDMQNGASCAPVTDWSTYANRLIDASTVGVTNDTYGSCQECPAEILGCMDSTASNYNSEANVSDDSCVYSILFMVDMSLYEDVFSTPEVNGSWNGWCGGCTPMSDIDNDGVWQVTLDLALGFYEYKFSVDNWNDQEIFAGGESCTLTTGEFVNRTITVIGPAVMQAVCWESCQECEEEGCTNPLADNYNPSATTDDGSCVISGCTNPSANNYNSSATVDDGSCTFDITFILDMSSYVGSFGSPEVNGTWNGWCGACNVLTDVNNDNIWEGTFSVPSGFHEFKYALDNWSDQEEFEGGESCTLTTGEFINRTLDVTTAFTYGAYCWELCESCQVTGCTDPNYIEYNPLAVVDNGSCNELVVLGCTYSEAMNFNVLANRDDFSCIFNVNDCSGDFNNDGVITATDLTGFLSVFGRNCE